MAKKKHEEAALKDVKGLAPKIGKKRLSKQSRRIVATKNAPLVEADLPISQEEVLSLVREEFKEYYGHEREGADLPMVDSNIYESEIVPRVEARIKRFVEQRQAEQKQKRDEQRQRETVLAAVDPLQIKSFLLGQEVRAVTASENVAVHHRILEEHERRKQVVRDLQAEQLEQQRQEMEGVVTDSMAKAELASKLRKAKAEAAETRARERAYRLEADRQRRPMDVEKPPEPERPDVNMRDVPPQKPKPSRKKMPVPSEPVPSEPAPGPSEPGPSEPAPGPTERPRSDRVSPTDIVLRDPPAPSEPVPWPDDVDMSSVPEPPPPPRDGTRSDHVSPTDIILREGTGKRKAPDTDPDPDPPETIEKTVKKKGPRKKYVPEPKRSVYKGPRAGDDGTAPQETERPPTSEFSFRQS